MSHGSHHSSNRGSAIRRRGVYFEESPPDCILVDGVLVCPSDVGDIPVQSDFLTVYPGWNVWDVYQVNDLPFSIMMIGVDKDKQLRIWVEDSVRLGAPGAIVADPADFKGSQVEILNGLPAGLTVADRKETVAGPAMVVNGPATLRTVRFYNRGAEAELSWPHNDSYLLDKDYVPSASNPATSGPAPTTIGQTVGQGIVAPVEDVLKQVPPVVYYGAALLGGLYVADKLGLFKKDKNARTRISRNPRSR